MDTDLMQRMLRIAKRKGEKFNYEQYEREQKGGTESERYGKCKRRRRDHRLF